MLICCSRNILFYFILFLIVVLLQVFVETVIHFFRLFLIEKSSKERLFDRIEIFCKIINVFVLTVNVLSLLINLMSPCWIKVLIS